jgi:hypothetical protein
MNVSVYNSLTLHDFIVTVCRVVRCNGALCCMTVAQQDSIGKDV